MSRTHRRPRLAVVALAACCASGCAGATDAAGPVGSDAGPSGTTAVTGSVQLPGTTTRDLGGVVNPVYDTDFPDPDVVALEDGSYVAVATNGNGRHVQVATSSDLVDWQQGDDALPVLPSWTSAGKVWAPEIIRLPDAAPAAAWAMYYTTKAPDETIQCIGVAVAAEATGPYRDTSRGPLVCEQYAGGSIDAHPFRASDGSLYLYWKNDGNAVGVDTWISGQRLAPDGRTLQGAPRRLLKQDLPWEGDLVEAPFVTEHDGVLRMFYSANSYASADYAVGLATATSPLGPWTKRGDPVLTSDSAAAGPGHCSVFTDPEGQVWMAYHGWPADAPGDAERGRSMYLSRVRYLPDGGVEITPPAGG